jgi:hypothetical protein
MEAKKTYSAPELTKWGTVVDLTQNGNTTPAVNDSKGGSNGNFNNN